MIRLAETGGGTPRYRLKITLRDCQPPIWRRIVVRADMKLDRLHRVIQTAMGWSDCHLHQFVVGRVFYGQPDLEGDDFGDSWEHEVLVEEVLPPDPDFKHPVCLDGANACPPEDCGGSPGYAEFVDAIADPKHEQHEEMKEWVGGAWDATRFSLEHTNAGLKRIKA
jgi:hypothetical protein